ncbi:hypothetical protein [Paracoccus aminovorans]|uniref:hypothetical protein n=1 Tax=Paracoccus aminovorans TaxID=34004 RepID=UPI002B261E96|nr:hypothetical protein [Paracoccus aminovorans]
MVALLRRQVALSGADFIDARVTKFRSSRTALLPLLRPRASVRTAVTSEDCAGAAIID